MDSKKYNSTPKSGFTKDKVKWSAGIPYITFFYTTTGGEVFAQLIKKNGDELRLELKEFMEKLYLLK
jgi:hypothetical protein